MKYFQLDGNNTYQEDGFDYVYSDEHRIDIAYVSDGHGTCIKCMKRAGHRARDIVSDHFIRLILDDDTIPNNNSNTFNDDMKRIITNTCHTIQTEYFPVEKEVDCSKYGGCHYKGGITIAGVVRNLTTGDILAFNLGDCRIHTNHELDSDLLYDPLNRTIDQDFVMESTHHHDTWRKMKCKNPHKSVVTDGIHSITFAGSLGDTYCPILRREPTFYVWKSCISTQHILIASDGLWDLLTQRNQSEYFDPYLSNTGKLVTIDAIKGFVTRMIGNSVWDNVTVLYLPPIQQVKL